MASNDTPDLVEYVVIADAIMLTTGKKTNGRPQVTRLLRNTTINAVEDDPRLAELVAQGGVVRKEDLKSHVKGLNSKSGPRRPAVVRAGDGEARITAAGTAISIAPDDDLPEQPVGDVQPIAAPSPDLSPVG